MKIERLKEGIKNISEPRRTKYGNVKHKLEDIIIIGLCTVICGGEDFTDMDEFGKTRQEFLGEFLELPNGIPDSDTFRRVFEKLDPSELSECLINWISVEREKRSVVAVTARQYAAVRMKSTKPIMLLVHLLPKINLLWVKLLLKKNQMK